MADVEKATNAAATLMEKLSEYLDAAEKVVVHYAPQVWDATLTIIRVQSIVMLVIWIAGVSICTYAMRKAIGQFKANARAPSYREEREWPIPVSDISRIGLFLCFVAAICEGVHVLLGIFSPELAVLYSLCVKAGLL